MATITFADSSDTWIMVNIGQNATTNMDNWKVFLDGVSNRTGTFPASTSHSAQITVSNLQPSTTYTISVYYYMGTTQIGSGAADQFSTTAPPKPPQPTGLSVSVSGGAPATITATWNASSGATSYNWSYYGASSNNGAVTTTSKQVSGLPAGSYTFYVSASNSSGTSTEASKPFTVSAPRPANWAWYYAKTAGSGFNITATEWNDFLIRLNDFRDYKTLGRVSFPTYYTGDDFTADAYNLAANHVDAVSGRAQQYYNSGDDIPASAINKLRDDLNSIP